MQPLCAQFVGRKADEGLGEGLGEVQYGCTLAFTMFTFNELTVVEYLRAHPFVDFSRLVEGTGLAKSSAHVVLSRLTELGVVETRKGTGSRSVKYAIAPRDVVERAAADLLSEFRKALYPTEYGGTKPRLVFTDSYVLPEPQLQELRHRYDVVTYDESPTYVNDDLLRTRSLDAEVIVRFDFGAVDRKFLRKMPRLRAIVLPNCEPSNIDFQACKEFGVQVRHADIRSQKYFARTQLEYVVNAAFSLMRPLQSASIAVREGQGIWSSKYGEELGGKRVGILFSDSDLSRMVEVFRSLGCDVRAANALASPPLATQFGLQGYSSLREVWDWSDLLVLIDSPQVDLDALLRSPRSPAYLIVTNRKAAFDKSVMADALAGGRIRGLALDYLDEPETVASDTWNASRFLGPLFDLPNVLATPELGVLSTESLKRSYEQTFAMLMDLDV